MKSTPPLARSNAFLTFIAVWPTYCPTRSARPHSIKVGASVIPSLAKIWASKRATVVLAVPGLPVNSMCLEKPILSRPKL